MPVVCLNASKRQRRRQKVNNMKNLASVFATALLGSVVAFGQSSGNFSATGTSASCVIGAGGILSGGTELAEFTANISTGSGNGTTLNIRPSVVTGLFAKTKIDTSVPSASADIGLEVCVKVDGSDVGVYPKSCVVYDQRFQQISSDLFSQLTACTLITTTTTCTADIDCAPLGATYTCNNPAGGTGVCVAPTANPLCNFELILSTLSAHSFDFVVPVDNKKPHSVSASWKIIGLPGNNTGGTSSSVASCVGPGILTVTQTKVFNNSGSLTFTGN
jgi:hypothetical protein